METRLDKQMQFIFEADKMKNILRRSLIADGSRRENDAEHSWHIALMSMLLLEYTNTGADGVDLLRVMKMVIIHDLVEIYAGDTFAYDTEGYESKARREAEAADKIFGMLPEDQGHELRELWEEFDRMDTPDSKYASSIDRLQPLISNYLTEGFTWKSGNVTRGMVYKRMDVIRSAAPALWSFVEKVVDESIEKGYLTED